MDIVDRDEKIDSVLLNIVHLWDDEKLFNTSYPYTCSGIGLKFRMFKNIGRSQMISKEGKLHFIPIPYTGNVYHAPILIHHYGHLSQEMRKSKYDFYMKEDTEQCQKDYTHLVNDHVGKSKVENLSIDHLQEAIRIFKFSHT